MIEDRIIRAEGSMGVTECGNGVIADWGLRICDWGVETTHQQLTPRSPGHVGCLRAWPFPGSPLHDSVSNDSVSFPVFPSPVCVP